LGCLLGSTEDLCSKLASDLTHAVVQATDMFSQVNMHFYLMFFLASILITVSTGVARSFRFYFSVFFFEISTFSKYINTLENVHLLYVFTFETLQMQYCL